jgi:imidazolonepropionase-like amidohydrolase
MLPGLAGVLPLLSLILPCAQQDAPPPRDAVLLLDVRIWEGDADAAERREDVLFRRGRKALRGELARESWPAAHAVEAAEDWILYPARFHANYEAKLGEGVDNPYRSEASDVSAGPVTAMEFGARASFRAWERAADLAAWGEDEGKAWRDVGFTRVQVLPTRGLLQGRAMAASLNALPLGDALLLRDGLELRSLRGTGGYPGTPMAALAVHRQLLADAAQRATLPSARPAPDLELTGKPIWRARSAREVENVLDLMAEQPPGWLILGGREAVLHAERLRAAQVGVLYVLELPEAPKTEQDLAYDDGAERQWWQDPLALREEQRRRHGEQVADWLALRAAGVACALVPGGTAKDLAEDLALLVAAGADADDLHRALGPDLEALLGLPPSDDGVVSRGPLDPAKPDLAWVFADGRGFEHPKAAAATEGGGGGSGDAQALAGDWLVTVQTPMGEQKFGIALDPSAATVKIFEPESPEEREDARNPSYAEGSVRCDFTVPEMNMEVTLALRLDGERLTGELTTPFGPVPAVAVRRVAEAAPPASPGGPPGERPGGRRGPRGGRGGAQEPAADADAAAKSASEERRGHPAWPVETEAERVPASEWARARGRSVLLKGATLWRVDGSAPSVGDLLIVDGVIEAVGGRISAREGVPAVDAGGWHVMPAVIDAHSHLALDAINEGSMSITAECRIADMIHARDVGIWRAAAGGTALVQSLHGSANPIGGQAAVWELDYAAERIADLLYPQAPQGIKFALGENVKQSNSSTPTRRFPASRVGVEAVYRRAFAAAQDYARARAEAADAGATDFRRDVRLEVLADILDGRIHVQCHSYRADEIQMFLRVCRDFGILAPTFQHVLEGYKVAPELAAYGAMASTFSDWWAYKFEVNDAIPWNVEILHKAGVTVSINSDSDEMIRRLNTEAAKAMRYGGLDWESAMRTCTLNSAAQLHLAERMGSLTVGKDGNVTVYDAPPLSGYARCVLTIARGRVLYERDRAAEQRWLDYADAARAFAQAVPPAEPVPAADPAAPPAPAEPAAPAPPRARAPADAAAWERWTREGHGLAYLVEGATIHSSGRAPFTGTVLVRDGRFVAIVAADEAAPAAPDALLVDATGMHLYPGFLNCGDVTGLFEVGAVRSARDDSEIGEHQADLIAGNAVHADSPHVAVARTNGLAYVLLTPAGGVVRGQASLIQLAGTTSEDLVVEPSVGLLLDFPRAGRTDPKKGPEEPRELAALTRAFDAALDYGAAADRLRDAGQVPERRDARMEAMLPFARGERPLIIEADDAATLMAARAWARTRGLEVIWLGAREAWKVAGFFGADGARMITGPVHALPTADHEPFDAPFRNASILRAAGCTVALRTADPEQTRNLPYQAATAAAFGLGRDEALHALTLGAAATLGVDELVGSIEPGKVASFFLCDGDPLDFGVVERIWIGGREQSIANRQSELRERYLRRLAPR